MLKGLTEQTHICDLIVLLGPTEDDYLETHQLQAAKDSHCERSEAVGAGLAMPRKGAASGAPITWIATAWLPFNDKSGLQCNCGVTILRSFSSWSEPTRRKANRLGAEFWILW